MKKLYMTMAAMLCGFAAMAQEVNDVPASVVVEPLAFTADGKTVTTMAITLETENNAAFTSAGIVFELPEGIEVNQVYDEDDEEYKFVVTYPIAKSSHTTMLRQSPDNKNKFTLAVAGSATFKTSTNVVANVELIADENMTPGDYQLTFGQCSFGNGQTTKRRYTPDPVAITVASGTGINSINAADSKAPIYNLAGQRVSKAQQGVFIQNGKKIANK